MKTLFLFLAVSLLSSVNCHASRIDILLDASPKMFVFVSPQLNSDSDTGRKALEVFAFDHPEMMVAMTAIRAAINSGALAPVLAKTPAENLKIYLSTARLDWAQMTYTVGKRKLTAYFDIAPKTHRNKSAYFNGAVNSYGRDFNTVCPEYSYMPQHCERIVDQRTWDMMFSATMQLFATKI